MLKLLSLIVPALVTPPQAAPGGQGCPVVEDMQQDGIWIQYDDWVTHYRQTAPDTVVEISYYEDESDPYYIESHFGLYITLDSDAKDGRPNHDARRLHVFPEGVLGLPEPAAGVDWTGSMKIFEAGQDDPLLEKHTYRITAAPPLQIGTCSYDSLKIEAVYDYLDGEGDADEIRYLPALGISVLTATGAMGQDYDSRYSATAISRTRP